MRCPRGRWVLLFAIVSAEACDPSTGPDPCTASGVGVITISAGTTPSISWAAGCRAERLAVFFVTTGTATWELRAGRRGIPKPVTYGVVPAGVLEEHAVEALQIGTTYGVFVTVATSGGGRASAVATFTP
jgi:hypothetical protein